MSLKGLKFMFLGWKSEVCKKLIENEGGIMVDTVQPGIHSIILADTVLTDDSYRNGKRVKEAVKLNIPLEVAQIFFATKFNKKLTKKEDESTSPAKKQPQFYTVQMQEPLSIDEIEESIDKKLYHGDILLFKNNKYYFVKKLVKNKILVEAIVNNKELTVPLEITKKFTNIKSSYNSLE